MKIEKYKVVMGRSDDIQHFEGVVNGWMEQGWRVSGSLVVLAPAATTYQMLIQSLVWSGDRPDA